MKEIGAADYVTHIMDAARLIIDYTDGMSRKSGLEPARLAAVDCLCMPDNVLSSQEPSLFFSDLKLFFQILKIEPASQ